MRENMRKCGAPKLYFSFEVIPTTTIAVGSTRNKIIRVLIKPESTTNLSLSTTSIYSSSKSIDLLHFVIYG